LPEQLFWLLSLDNAGFDSPWDRRLWSKVPDAGPLRLVVRSQWAPSRSLTFICQGVMVGLPLSHDKARGPA